ncbi:hypothetical protein BH18ACI4_BH18ACI4_15850 [soil metagenome]
MRGRFTPEGTWHLAGLSNSLNNSKKYLTPAPTYLIIPSTLEGGDQKYMSFNHSEVAAA